MTALPWALISSKTDVSTSARTKRIQTTISQPRKTREGRSDAKIPKVTLNMQQACMDKTLPTSPKRLVCSVDSSKSFPNVGCHNNAYHEPGALKFSSFFHEGLHMYRVPSRSPTPTIRCAFCVKELSVLPCRMRMSLYMDPWTKIPSGRVSHR